MTKPDVKPDTWMPLYVSDYLADTSHLSTEEHGAYLLLLMHAWINGGEITGDDTRLRRICRMEEKQWRKSKEEIKAFFYEENGCLRHHRVDKELERAQHLVNQRSAAGKASAAKRKEQRNAAQEAYQNTSDCSTSVATSVATSVQRDGQQNGKPSPSPTPCKPIGIANSNSTPTDSGQNEVSPAAVRFALAIRGWEKERGKVTAIQPADPRLTAWGDAGVTDDQLRIAYDLAVDARNTEGDTTAINAGFLDVFVAKVRKPVNGASAVSKLPPAGPWFMSASGIVAKGKEFSVEQKVGELFPHFKARVLSAAGISDEDVRKARIDAGERI